MNDVRQIKDEVLFAPNSCRYKVYIIDEVHMLSNSAFNALLKTIEEPPPYIVFIFATTEIHKVPATIRSRCQQFNFRLIPLEQMVGLLEETAKENGITAEPDALLWIAKEATGSLRDAYTLFDQVVSFSEGAITLEKIHEKLGIVGLDDMNALLEACARGDRKGAFEQLDGILEKGVAVEQFVFDCAGYFRSLLFMSAGITKEAILGFKTDSFSPEVLKGFPPQKSQKAIELLFQLYRNLRYSANQRFELELVISRIADLKDYIDPADLGRRFEALRRNIFASAGGTLAGSTLAGGTAAGDTGGAGFAGPDRGGPGDAAPEETTPEAEEPYDEREEPAETERSGAKEGELSVSDREKVILLVKKKKLSLASALEKGVSWNVEGSGLTIGFSAVFPAKIVGQELPEIATAVETVIGRKLKISVRVEDGGNEQGGVPEPDQKVEMVRKIFRGEILSGDK